MKKILLVLAISLILTLGWASVTFADNRIMVSYDMAGDYRSYTTYFLCDEDVIHYDVDPGYSIGYEWTNEIRRVELGLGIETQLNRSLADNKDAKFGFSPMYFTIYAHFSEDEVAPFFVGRIGLNLFHTGNESYQNAIFGSSASLDGGLYYAFGFGLNTRNNTITLLRSTNYGDGDSDSDGDNRNVNYTKYSIIFGLKF